jgi:hypothetical protein
MLLTLEQSNSEKLEAKGCGKSNFANAKKKKKFPQEKLHWVKEDHRQKY